MITFRKILCPTDLSASSNEALRHAIALACAHGARVTVCHCLEPPRYADEAARAQAQAQIELAINKYHLLYAPAPLEWEARVIEGDPTVDIVTESAAQGVDLIVIQSRRRPLAAAVFGSTAEAICRNTPCPVLVTHRDEREWDDLSGGKIVINRVLAAHDFSPNAEAAVACALSLAQEHRAELHLIHVIPPSDAHLPYAADVIQEADRKLREAIPEEAQLWCRVEKGLRSGRPSGEVLAYASEHKIDLICLGKHGSGGNLLTLFGSNTDRVLRQAPCPVLVTPAIGTVQPASAPPAAATLSLA